MSKNFRNNITFYSFYARDGNGRKRHFICVYRCGEIQLSDYLYTFIDYLYPLLLLCSNIKYREKEIIFLNILNYIV